MSIQRWRGWLFVALFALNVALFVPLFLTVASRVDMFPFTPREHPGGAYGFDVVSVIEYVKSLVLRRANGDVFRVSVEFVALLLLTGVFRNSRRVRNVATSIYVAVLFLLAYHHAYRALYRVEPAVWEDVRLLPSLLGYVASVTHPSVPLGLFGLVVGMAYVAWRVTNVAFTAWQERVTPRALLVLGVVLLWGIASSAWFGVKRDDPVMQLPSKALKANVQTSFQRRAQWDALRSTGTDNSYRMAQRAKLQRKPRVYLLMLEAYGQRLVSDAELKGPFEQLAARVTERLAAKNYAVRSAFSRAPVYGGRSWLSVATVQTGVFIDAPSIFDEMSPHATQLATFTEFFRTQGYRSFALLPGNYMPDAPPDAYGRDVVLDSLNLGYTGERHGYVGVPDQYSLRTYRSRVLDAETQPFLAFYLSISTHHPFPDIPFEGDDAWAPIDGVDAIQSTMHKPYFKSVEYQWRTLLEFIDAENSDDAVFILIGDHQPLLERTMDDVRELTEQQSANTPVHVISRNKAFVERFAKYAFVPGVFAPAGTGNLRHEGLQSLFIHEIVGEYGGVAEQRFTRYFPQGIGLGGLVAPKSGDVGAGADGDRAADEKRP